MAEQSRDKMEYVLEPEANMLKSLMRCRQEERGEESSGIQACSEETSG